ncbi:type VII secretion-associated serine protease mycosin [Corynebacterium canis]|uniref:Type VII secretion-associated serine protease mycosin n=1 Tax=Corynebacterium canis TaxID=679663 RepID=A0A5C5UA40_9CORY|nr:type VII secretion-associated serine protease mycosin [Corynebacterium canis]TWT22816.1 type VII secretion-associated serine protease mycosin [Corynebacterium canis]WJY74264.1 Subtilisin DY [Corynebacterium canis]
MSFRCKAAVTGLIVLCALVYLLRPPIAQAAEGLPQAQCPQALPVESLPAETKSSWARAHEFATGAGVKVAVIDTGIYPHPYLPQVQPIADLVDGAREGALTDCDGHGTVVAGVLAGRGPLDGVAPDIELLSIRQTSSFAPSESSAGTLDSLAEAIELALDRGAQIINVSVVSCVPGRGQPMETVLDGALARAEELNVVVVAAAGNVTAECQPDSAVLPAHSPTVLAVSASSDAHNIAPYSIPGLADHPQVAASGHVKVAASPRDAGFVGGIVDPQGGSRPFEGTSFAAPVVTGTAALVKQRFPEASAAEIRDRITSSAAHGTGNVDPYAALTWLPTGLTRPAAAPPIDAPPTARTNPAAGRALQVVMALLVGAALSALLLRRRR